MLIDIFSEQQMAKPWPARHEERVFSDAIEQAVLADELGYGCWWQVEHHGAPEFSYSSAPELTLTALAMRTKRMRLGHAGVLMPHQINHPMRIGERIAVLDILSNGRVEVGLAKAGGGERDTFNAEGVTTQQELTEVAELLGTMWTQDSFSWDGNYVKIPERTLVPKPLQRPHPALWQTVSSLESFYNAGRLGLGVLGVTLLIPLSTLESCLAEFERGRAEGAPVSKVSNPGKGVWAFLHCTETREEAIESRAAEAALWYINSFPRLFKLDRAPWIDMIRGDGPPARPLTRIEDPMAGIDPDDPMPIIRLLNRNALGMEIDPVEAFEVLESIETVLIGDVDSVLKKAHNFKAIGVDRLLGLQQFGALPHENVMRSIELVGKHLVPALA